MAEHAFSQPLFILGSARSFTSVVCAMVGQHPQAYGMPELNLFLADTLKGMVQELTGYRQIQMHGLLRAVAQLYAGEQNMATVEMARRWILTRLEHSTAQVYYELCRKVAPLRIVDKSPVYSLKPENLARLAEAFPDAYYMHLVRHPRTQGESIMNVAKGLMAVLANSIDYSVDPPVLDPQINWYEMQINIMEFMSALPKERCLRLRGEDVLNDPPRYLRSFCRWLGINSGKAAIAEMMHPERSPYACLGPVGAHLGNDINFLRSPALRTDGKVRMGSLEGPVSWRTDGKGLEPRVIELARELGYS